MFDFNLLSGALVAYVGLIVLGIIGWIMNLIQVVNLALAHTPITDSYLLIKIVSVIFAPAGAVMGWVGLFV